MNTDPAPTGAWRTATVREVRHPSPRAVLLRLEVPDRIDHLPGQHYVVRLQADDGYVAQRSYSLASPPEDPLVELFVARLDEGEVSSFLAEVVQPGDELEVRGPIGGWFVWGGTTPALGVAGGSGVVPFLAMLRHARMAGRTDLLHLAVSARTPHDLPYAEELIAAGATTVFSRFGPPGGRVAGRLRPADLKPLVRATDPRATDPRATDTRTTDTRTTDGTGAAGPRTVFVCGSSGFAEAAGALLLDLGVPAAEIRVERFGPSGV